MQTDSETSRERSHSAGRLASRRAAAKQTTQDGPIVVGSQTQVVNLVDDEDRALDAAMGAAQSMIDKDL